MKWDAVSILEMKDASFSRQMVSIVGVNIKHKAFIYV